MTKYIHTNDIHWIYRASETLSKQPDVDSRTKYIKEKLISHLSYMTKVRNMYHLVLSLSDNDTILGIACYTIHTDNVKIDFVYKTCDLPHIGRQLVTSIISTTKKHTVKIDNLTGVTGYKCYTAGAIQCNYIPHPDNSETNINLSFSAPIDNPAIN